MSVQCFRIPSGIDLLRWQHESEWVLYHSGTGETLRLSDAAVAVLDLLHEHPGLSGPALSHELNALMDSPLASEEIARALDGLLGELLRHECIEPLPCD